MADAERLVVAAAVIEQSDRFLVTRRQAGVQLAGYWEFPGGKCEPGESAVECLRREIREELQTDVIVGDEIYATAHEDPARSVELHFFRCELAGEPRPALGQQVQWIARAELRTAQFPPADAELIEQLKAWNL
jgi:mutator protein MutT